MDIKDFVYEIKKALVVKFPRFGAEIAKTKFEYSTEIKTAATDGDTIYINRDFMESISKEHRIFVVAHEILHIKFEHMYRIKKTDGKLKNQTIWNIATDANINANLVKDGFIAPENAINMPEAINYTCEEFYDILLQKYKDKRKEEKDNNKKKGSDNNQNEESDDDNYFDDTDLDDDDLDDDDSDNTDLDNDDANEDQKDETTNEKQKDNSKETGKNTKGKQELDNDKEKQDKSGKENKSKQDIFDKDFFKKHPVDNHAMWGKAQNKHEKDEIEKNKQGAKQQKNSENQQNGLDKNFIVDKNNKNNDRDEDSVNIGENEKDEFEQNREEKLAQAQAYFSSLQRNGRAQTYSFNQVGDSKPVVDWKLILRREFDKDETIWSQRRSIAENNYAYRLEDYDIQDQAVTEVMLDTSGSVSNEMIKNFLRQLKPLLKDSKLRVACFDDKFYKFVDIKTNNDIDNFVINGRGGTDFNKAVVNFSNDVNVNKIMFTDGCDEMNLVDKKYSNILWLVYGNKNFKPSCGKVIIVDPDEFTKKNCCNQLDNGPDLCM